MTADLSQSLHKAVGRKRGALTCAMMTFGSVAVPLALRLAMDHGQSGAQFAFIYPAALAIAVLCGWRWALLSAAGGMLVTMYFLVAPDQGLPVDWQGWSVLVVVTLALLVIVFVGSALRRAIGDLARAQLEIATLNDELLHRSKNALQMIQALASGARASLDPGVFYQALEGRLRAMAAANQLLEYGAVPSCSVLDAVRIAIQPFDSRRILVDGVDCLIERGSVVPLALALHELATNATKYGALSNSEGCVRLSCTSGQCGDRRPTVTIEWLEVGGPEVVRPTSRGMGMRILSTQAGVEVLKLDFEPSGTHCVLRVKIQ